MKESLTDNLKTIVDNARRWVSLEVEYAKLTVAEKVTVLLTTLIIGAVCLLLGMVIIILFSFSLVDVFKTFMSPALACLSVGGILVLLIVLILLLRKPLLEDPIARLISKLILDIKPSEKKND